MSINKKIIIFLILCNFVISGVYITISTFSLKNIQDNSVLLFKKELLELNREVSEKNSNLFFNSIGGQIDRDEKSAGLLNYIYETHESEIQDIVVVDIKSKNVLPNFGRQEVIALTPTSVINKFLQENILNRKKIFEYDNFDDYEKDKTSTIVPSIIHFRVYEDVGMMIGLGEKFHTEKVRIEFIERNNESILKKKIYASVTLLGLFSIIQILFIVFIIRKIVIRPLKNVTLDIDEIKKNSFQKRVRIEKNDEISILGKSINELLDKIKPGESETEIK